MRSVECLCNPRAGHEYRRQDGAAEVSKRLVVIGGGAAGLSAALAAHRRGHQVTLVEKGARLGGQLALAGAPPGREEFARLGHDFAHQVTSSGIDVRLETSADLDLVRQLKPDAVVVATGGAPVKPPIPGSDLEHVVQAWDLLSGKGEAGRDVVVIGGGAVGVETALALAEAGTVSGEDLKFLLVHGAAGPDELLRLATRGRHRVTVVEMLDKLGSNFGKTTRWTMLDDLERYAVETSVGTRVLEITPEAVIVEKDGATQNIPADTVVLAVGTRAESQLVADLEKAGLPVHVVGDAKSPGMVFDAVHQGFAVGQSL